jgi:hypothetical protein
MVNGFAANGFQAGVPAAWTMREHGMAGGNDVGMKACIAV